MTHKVTIKDVLDKKSGAVILINGRHISCYTVLVYIIIITSVDSFDESGDQVCFNQFSTFIVGAGGFGGKRDSKHNKVTWALSGASQIFFIIGSLLSC